MNFSKIKYSTIDLLLLVLISTVLSFYKTSFYTLVRYIITIYLLLKYIKETKKTPLVFILIAAYSVILGLSSYYNNKSITWGLSGFMHGIQLLCIFSVLSSITQKRGIIEVVAVLYYIIVAFLIPTDLLIFLYPYKISSATVYLIGDKFHVAYMHCLLTTLFSVSYKKSNKEYLLSLLYLFSICVIVHIKCTTGVIMLLFCFGMEVLICFLPKYKKVICHIDLVAFFLVAVNVLIWGPMAILYSPWANHIIVDVLGKTNNMTGRFKLYSVIPELIVKKPIIGYGLQSDIFRNLFGYGNAQNGLMQIVIETGILGASIYFLALFLAGHKRKNDLRSYSFFIYLLSFILGSVSEMNLSTYFVFGIAILYSFNFRTEKTGL